MAVSGIRGLNSFQLSTLGRRQLAYLRQNPLPSRGANQIPTTAEALTAANLREGTVPLQNVNVTNPAPAATPAFSPAGIPGILAPTAARITVPTLNSAAQPQAPTAVPLTTGTVPTPTTTAVPPAPNALPQNAPPSAAPLQNAGLTTAAPAVTPIVATPVIIPPASFQVAAPLQNVAAAAPTPAAAPLTTTTATPAPAATPIIETPVITPAPIQVAVPQQNVVAAAPATATAPAINAAAAPAAEATTPPEAIQQAALLINEALRNLGVTAAASSNPLLTPTSPLLTALLATQELNPVQQNALLVNETLQNLNFVPPEQTNPLLINETPPRVEAAAITENLNLIQQNAQLINEALLELGVAATAGAITQTQPAAVQAVPAAAAQIEAAAAAVPQIENVTPTVPETAATVAAVAATPTATATTTAATTTTTAAAVTIPVTIAFPTQGLTPATFPLTLHPDRTPYVLVVYQPDDPAPLPRPPEPINREVPPTTPVERIRQVGDARLRQLLLHTGAGGRRRNAEYTIPGTVGQAEKSIRYTIGQVNADMAAQGLPLHLVFAKHENGFALDVYDCSYNEACRVSYDVPIPLDNLPGILGNLEHETGIIVDATS